MEEQLEQQEAERQARAVLEQVLTAMRDRVEGVDDTALEAEMVEVRKAQIAAAAALAKESREGQKEAEEGG